MMQDKNALHFVVRDDGSFAIVATWVEAPYPIRRMRSLVVPAVRLGRSGWTVDKDHLALVKDWMQNPNAEQVMAP